MVSNCFVKMQCFSKISSVIIDCAKIKIVQNIEFICNLQKPFQRRNLLRMARKTLTINKLLISEFVKL